MEKQIFGLSLKEIERQCSANKLKCDSNSPVFMFETLEPSIEGGKLILSDNNLVNLFNRIYTGGKYDE